MSNSLTSSEQSWSLIVTRRTKQSLELLLPLLVLLVLLRFNVARFWEIPYAGFHYQGSSATVTRIYAPGGEQLLQEGDRLLEVGELSWEEFERMPQRQLFEEAQPGDVIPLLVERSGERLTVPWLFPGFTLTEFLYRFSSEWWLPYIFWVGGVVSLLFLRPKNLLWRLLIAFNFVTAIWLAAGSVTQWHVANSLFVFRAAIWLAVPIYLHLHWSFPHPLGRLPRWITWSLYGIASAFVVAEWLRLLPADTYQIGFLIALLGSILLLFCHLLLRPTHRRAVGMLGIASLLIFVPLLALALTTTLGFGIPALRSGGALLAFPALPGVYFYIVYRRQLGRRRVRAHRLVRLFLAAVITSTLLLVLLMVTATRLNLRDSPLLLNSAIIVVFGLSAILGFAPFLSLSALADVDSDDADTLSGLLALSANRLLAPFLFLMLGGLLITISALLLGALLGFSPLLVLLTAFLALFLGATLYHPFQRLVDRHLLGIQLPSSQLLESYAGRITTCLNRSDLVDLHEEEVLPSLLVRQSALLYIPESDTTEVLSYIGVEAEPLHQLDRRSLPTTVERRPSNLPIDWVHLVLPLRLGVTGPETSVLSDRAGTATLGHRIVGYWLLGHRDPDDWYSDVELPTFKALADQTAVALTNIVQAENLRALYQSNIERREAERTRLALALHDEVLNGLAALRVYLNDDTASLAFQREYQRLTTRLRQTISLLRPAMLNYGLRAGIEELVEDLQERTPAGTQLYFELESGATRYPPRIEQHLFRIVQQAMENAIQHAESTAIRLRGALRPHRATIIVQDDGVGIPGFDTLDLTTLLAQQHFGIAGMYERARLIGARLHIDSGPQKGTTITVTWEPGGDEHS